MSGGSQFGDGPNYPPVLPEPDAHGQAALILAESILHMLVETRAVTLHQAIAAVQTATEVKADVAEEMGESSARMQHSLRLLTAIGHSLATDGSFAHGVAANEA